MRTLRTLPLLFCMALVSTMYAATWTKIDVPGATQTQVYGINSGGDIVGLFTDSNGTSHGFLLKAGTFTTIDVPGARGTVLRGINDNGIMTGWYYASDFFNRGFVYDGHTFTTLDARPGEDDTIVYGINNGGVVVGYWGCDCSNPDYHGFEWVGGTFTTVEVGPPGQTILTGINSKDHESGFNPFNWKSFLRNPTGDVRHFNFANPCCGIVAGLNEHKAMVGYYPGDAPGFKLTDSKVLVQLQFPHAAATYVYGINNNRQIVGAYLKRGVYHGFLMTK